MQDLTSASWQFHGRDTYLNHWPHYKGEQPKFFIRDLQFMWWGSRGSKDEIWAEYSLKQGSIIPRVRSGYLHRIGVSMLSDRVYMRNKTGAIKTLPFDFFTGLKCLLNTWGRNKSYARVSHTCSHLPGTSHYRILVYFQLRFEDWREERKMDEDPNTSPCKPTSCLHGINQLWFNLSRFWTGWFFFFDGTSGNIIKTPKSQVIRQELLLQIIYD